MVVWAAVSIAAAVALLGGCAGTKSGAGAGATSPSSVEESPRRLVAERSASRALHGDDLILDLSPAAEILTLWLEPTEAVRARARAIATDLPYQTLRHYYSMMMSCVPSDEEVTRAIAVPDSGICGFGLGSAYQERASVDSLVRALVLRGSAIRKRVAADVGIYAPDWPWKPVRIYFVIATRYLFDAVTLDRGLDGSGPTVIFNLSEALNYGGSTEERLAIVERVLAHETFHAVLRQVEYGKPGWERYHDPMNTFDYIARVVLDEGVAHYIDWKGRAGADTLFAARLSSREQRAFDQLALACRRLRDPRTDPEAREEILGMAATGPLWSKYGAISGMFAAWRIERGLGRDSLRAAIVGGPRELRRLYAAAAAADTSLKRWPKELE